MTRLRDKLRNLAGLTLVGAASLLALPAQAFPGGSKPGGGSSGGTAGGGDDDIGSLPSLAVEAPRWVLTGSRRDLKAVVQSVQGTGTVSVRPVSGDQYVATFHGNLEVALNVPALATTGVTAAFLSGDAFDSAAAWASSGSWAAPVDLETIDAIELPLGAVASLEEPLVFVAVHPELGQYGLNLAAHGDVLVLKQVTRF